MSVFGKAIDAVSRGLLALGGVAIAVMVLAISADVALKALTGHPIPATLEVTTYYFMPLAALAAIAIEQRDRHHISVELFARALPARTRAALDLFAAVLTLALMLAIAWYSFEDAVRKTAAGEYVFVGFFDLPTWPARWLVPAVSLACAAVSMAQLAESLRRLSGRASGPAAAP